MFKRGIRDGISNIPTRYAEANHKYLENYDKRKPNIFIQDLDANNLFGWTMSKQSPVGEFTWVKDLEKIEKKSL